MKKLRITLLLIAAFVLLFNTTMASAAQSKLSGKIVINGSTALLPLTLQAAKEFKALHPKVKISASGAGSVTGPQSVRKGIADIGACDWDASVDVPGFKKFDGQVAHKVAVIPFATIVHKENKVTNLSTKQLQDIFSGKVTNWKEVGGDDAEIIVVNRKFGSGTRVNFQDKALKGEEFMSKGSNYKEVGSSGEMQTTVKSNKYAIGYADLVYVKGDIKALGLDGVDATIDNVLNGKYKVWGYGYFMTKGEPTGATKEFIEYIQSAKFQNGSLKKLKFIPISAMK